MSVTEYTSVLKKHFLPYTFYLIKFSLYFRYSSSSESEIMSKQLEHILVPEILWLKA